VCCAFFGLKKKNVSYGKGWMSNFYLKMTKLTLLLKHITGHREQPNVQQQQTQPQKSHFTLTGSVFLSNPFIRIMVALYSSGAIRDTRPLGNSELKRLLRPNLE
jgi:hypothetical protein